MERRLVEANLKSDVTILDEVISLMSEIKSGWDAIPEEVRKNPEAYAAQETGANVPAAANERP
jgi:flagellar protein FliS